VSSLPTRIGLCAAAGIPALIVFGTTMWFLGVSLRLLLEAKGLNPPAAAGLTGVAGLALTVVLGLLAKLALRSPRRRAAPLAAPAAGITGVAGGIAADLGALAARQIVDTTRAHPYRTMGAALVAGIAVGAVPELRKAIKDLFK
jgi:hypothetical protein